MFKVCKGIVLALAGLLGLAKFVLFIAGFVDPKGKAAWKAAEKGIVDYFFKTLMNLVKSK